MTRSFVFLLLIGLLLIPVEGRSQINRRLATEYVTRGTSELEAGNLELALSQFERAIELELGRRLL